LGGCTDGRSRCDRNTGGRQRLSAFLKALADVAAISTGTGNPISVRQVNARA
jgi:hypothetical protein